VAFRFVAANQHPNHDTIATFRKSFLKEIEALFVQILLLAREMGLLRMGMVALDGTKIHANASKHSALSYEHAGKIEAQLKAEVAELMTKAEAADQADVPDGMSIPDELARREERLKQIAEARAKIEARAKESDAAPQAAPAQEMPQGGMTGDREMMVGMIGGMMQGRGMMGMRKLPDYGRRCVSGAGLAPQLCCSQVQASVVGTEGCVSCVSAGRGRAREAATDARRRARRTRGQPGKLAAGPSANGPSRAKARRGRGRLCRPCETCIMLPKWLPEA
jgi:hypothetical protein